MPEYSFDITIKDDNGKVRCVVGGNEETLAKAHAACRRNEAYYLNLGYTEARIHSRLWATCQTCKGSGSIRYKRNMFKFKECAKCKGTGRAGDFIPIDWTPASDREYVLLARVVTLGQEFDVWDKLDVLQRGTNEKE